MSSKQVPRPTERVLAMTKDKGNMKRKLTMTNRDPAAHKRSRINQNTTDTSGSPVPVSLPPPSEETTTMDDSEVIDMAGHDTENCVEEPEGSEVELGEVILMACIQNANKTTERLMEEWTLPIYACFSPTPDIIHVDGRHAHKFKCCASGCKQTIRRFLDKSDAKSTGNMHRHVRICWGEDVVAAIAQAKNITAARDVVKQYTLNRTITDAFKRTGKGKALYSHWLPTKAETWCIVTHIILYDGADYLQCRDRPLGVRKPVPI